MVSSWCCVCRVTLRRDNFPLHLEVVLVQQSRLSCRIPHEDTPLLGGLDVRLVVATDAIADRNERELFLIKVVAVLRGDLQQPICESVVVLLLLDRVVESRVSKILFSVRNEEVLELKTRTKVRECLSMPE